MLLTLGHQLVNAARLEFPLLFSVLFQGGPYLALYLIENGRIEQISLDSFEEPVFDNGSLHAVVIRANMFPAADMNIASVGIAAANYKISTADSALHETRK